ncbi:MAG: hypothetical protein BWK76_27890 [Desulfobulbaceae bacterium A2]|nr:MAG: hypothetical protein BWK76_27890 [Desulfobulbaceae bacterium A2]
MSALEQLPAPDCCLAGSDGREHCLAAYRGQSLVICFYPRDNTPGCTKEACGFRDLTTDFNALGVTVLHPAQALDYLQQTRG